MQCSPYSNIILIFSILHFETLQTLCSPTNFFDRSDYDITVEATTTESTESLMHRLWGTQTTPEVKNIQIKKSRPDKYHFETIDFTPKQSINVSNAFYYKENVSNYPDLSKLEHFLKEYETFFDKNLLETKTLMEPDEEKYKHLCGSHKSETFPQEVLNSKNEKVLLVNSDKYVQKINVEVCGSYENSPCGDYLKNFDDRYEPMCKQNFISRQMVVLKETGDKDDDYVVAEDEIAIPGCCECVLKDKTL